MKSKEIKITNTIKKGAYLNSTSFRTMDELNDWLNHEGKNANIVQLNCTVYNYTIEHIIYYQQKNGKKNKEWQYEEKQ